VSFLKGLIAGTILTLVVAGIFGANGQSAGVLFVHGADFQGYHFYWSWPLFVAGSGLGWFIFSILE
jgi:hypothetical protein